MIYLAIYEWKETLQDIFQILEPIEEYCRQKSNTYYGLIYRPDANDVLEDVIALESCEGRPYQDLAALLREKKTLTSLYENFKELSFSLNNVLFHYFCSKYGVDYSNYCDLKKYLSEHDYHFKEDRMNSFQSQLKKNASEYGIYLKDGFRLVSLFDGSDMTFQTEDEVQSYVNDNGLICITPESCQFEKEFKKYYDYLVSHGYQYTTNRYYNPCTIAEELADIFHGDVLIGEDIFPFYCPDFSYEGDLNNEEYFQKLEQFLSLKHNKEFIDDYKRVAFVDEKLRSILHDLETLGADNKKVINEVEHNKECLNHDVLFLQKCYEYYIPQFGLSEYTLIDYYKALDSEALRQNLKRDNIGCWKTTRNSFRNGRREGYCSIYGVAWDWRELRDYSYCHNKKLKSEIEQLSDSTSDDIDELLQGRYVIVANQNLDYDTLMDEYYASFGMSPEQFTSQIQEKYGCDVRRPKDHITQSRMLIRK